MRRGFKCKKEIIENLRKKYDEIVENEYNGDFLDVLRKFDEIAEKKLRKMLKYYYESGRGRDQAWKTCKGSLYEYAVYKVLNSLKPEKYTVLMGDDALSMYGNRIAIKNWCDIYPDADIILVERDRVKAIISCKTSLRERLTETAFWKRELERNPDIKDVKLIFVTTDKDNELRTETNRYILLHVIDCTFVSDPVKYKKLIEFYRKKYGERDDFHVLVNKVREIGEIRKYLKEL